MAQGQGFNVSDYLKAKAAGGATIVRQYGTPVYMRRFYNQETGEAQPAIVPLDRKEVEKNLEAAQQEVATLQAILVDIDNAPEVIPGAAQS